MSMRTPFKTLIAAGLLLIVIPAWAQQPVPKVTKANIAQADLFIAISSGNVKAAGAALKAGADPNKPTNIDFTPLYFARTVPMVNLLLTHGALINKVTTRGSALTGCLLRGDDKMGMYLLDKGARPNLVTLDGTTALMNASQSGLLTSLSRLLKMKADVNAKNADGATALTYAARANQIEAAKLLLGAGAKVNDWDRMMRTPLHYAALRGYSEMAQLLISRGASVKAKDAHGSTPLHLAARYMGDVKTVQALLSAGADRRARDTYSKTAYELASRRGNDLAAHLVASPSSVVPAVQRSDDPVMISSAVRPAMNLIQRSMKVNFESSGCASCHHYGPGMVAFSEAIRHRMPIDRSVYDAYIKKMDVVAKYSAPALSAALVDPKCAKLLDMTVDAELPPYVVAAMRVCGVSGNKALEDTALLFGRDQSSDGHWDGGQRGTMQHSDVTNTAIVLDALNAYWPKEKMADLQGRKTKAKAWVLKIKPSCDEDLAARILVLKETGADQQQIASAVEFLGKAQRKDGGWGLPSSTQSDAYTTGLSLYALRAAANLPVSDERVRNAVAFLLRTQDEDGSWYVAKATKAFNNHFDTTFPNGFDQFASFAGTCWATIGLMQVMPD